MVWKDQSSLPPFSGTYMCTVIEFNGKKFLISTVKENRNISSSISTCKIVTYSFCANAHVPQINMYRFDENPSG